MTFLQHQDRNISPASYKHLKPDELLVTSIFYTIQGEGPYAGMPAVFIRLAGCDRGLKAGMGCEFCDTAFQFDYGKPLNFDEIHELIIDVIPKGIKRPPVYGTIPTYGIVVVITGGEPMLQNNLAAMFSRLYEKGFWPACYQIESNGDRLIPTMSQSINMGANCPVILVVSPKVVKGKYKSLKPEVWDRASSLKFVISGDTDSPYNNVPDYAHEFNAKKGSVYLSPLTVYKKAHIPALSVSAWDAELVDHAATAKNYARTAHLALKYGYRVSMQQHLFFNVP